MRVRSSGIAILLGAAAVVATSCRESPATTKGQVVQQSVSPAGLPDPLASVGGEKITIADVRADVGEQLDLLDAQYRRARDKIIGSALDTIVRERLIDAEVKKTGKSAQQLLMAEIGGSPDPTDVEISTWYKENQSRLGGRTLDQTRAQITDYLKKQRVQEASDKLEKRLRAEVKVAMNFEPYRLRFSNTGAPTIGPETAPVTLVEFSDFQCPYCRAAAPTLKQIASKYGDKVHIVYRQYPIASLHPFAFKAAEASLCANEQGKFWPLHDRMFDDQSKLGVSDLKQQARELGMDGKKFDACLDAGKYVEQVQNDMKEGQRSGVTGTPAIFLNGRVVEGGSVPFSVLEALIDKELARAKPVS
jgi:protein-disulfide isomerase